MSKAQALTGIRVSSPGQQFPHAAWEQVEAEAGVSVGHDFRKGEAGDEGDAGGSDPELFGKAHAGKDEDREDQVELLFHAQ